MKVDYRTEGASLHPFLAMYDKTGEAKITTGVYGYPKREAAQVAVSTVSGSMEGSSQLSSVVFCVFDDVTHADYDSLLAGKGL